MRILFEARCAKNYLAKCHEAFRTGLRRTFDTRMYGIGYDGYDLNIKNYSEIMSKTFESEKPDLIIASFESEYNLAKIKFNYDGMDKIDVPKAIILSDYWRIAKNYKYDFEKAVNDNNIDIIISLFPQPLKIWEDTSIKNKFVYLPFTFDPEIFNDWNAEKVYDVGFLAAGTCEYTDFYPERYNIHHKLLNDNSIKYLWAQHPGWNSFDNKHPLVGKNFSQLINSCKIFVTTGGKYHNAQPKIMEALASKTLVMSDRVLGEEIIGLEDGLNYVLINEDNVIDKIHYYLNNPKLIEEISENGYRLVFNNHSCYSRANEFYQMISDKLGYEFCSSKDVVHSKRLPMCKINFWNIGFMNELSKGREYYKKIDGMRDNFVTSLNCKIKGDNCYIWGGGVHTLKLMNVFSDANFNLNKIKGIIDSDKLKSGKKINGIEVIWKDTLAQNGLNHITDIIISSKEYENDIAIEISRIFGDKVNIIKLYDEEMKIINPLKYYMM